MFIKALRKLMPLGGWSTDDTLLGTVIHPDGEEHGYTIPTETEINDTIVIIEAEEASVKYKEDRKPGLPIIGDQLDVIWKQFNQMRLNGQPLIPEADDMLDNILSNKDKYPKP